MTLPRITRSNQITAMLLGYLVFSVVYLGSDALQWVPPQVLAPSAIDLAIPFIPDSIWIYVTQFLLLPMAIVSTRTDMDRTHALYAMLIATILAASVFIAWPTQVTRITPPDEGFTALAWRALFFVDAHGNCFPSLHVALALIAGRALWRSGYFLVALIWPAIIAASTLTTKQHVAWDVAGGIGLAVAAIWITSRTIRLERTQPVDHPAGA